MSIAATFAKVADVNVHGGRGAATAHMLDVADNLLKFQRNRMVLVIKNSIPPSKNRSLAQVENK